MDVINVLLVLSYAKFGCHVVDVYTQLSMFSILTFNVGFDLLFRVPRDRVEVRNRIREEWRRFHHLENGDLRTREFFAFSGTNHDQTNEFLLNRLDCNYLLRILFIIISELIGLKVEC